MVSMTGSPGTNSTSMSKISQQRSVLHQGICAVPGSPRDPPLAHTYRRSPVAVPSGSPEPETGGKRVRVSCCLRRSANRPTQELGQRISVYYESTGGLKRQRVNTSKNCLIPDQPGIFMGKSGHSSRSYVMVLGVCMEASLW